MPALRSSSDWSEDTPFLVAFPPRGSLDSIHLSLAFLERGAQRPAPWEADDWRSCYTRLLAECAEEARALPEVLRNAGEAKAFLRAAFPPGRFHKLCRLGAYFATDEHADDLRLVAAALERSQRKLGRARSHVSYMDGNDLLRAGLPESDVTALKERGGQSLRSRYLFALGFVWFFVSSFALWLMWKVHQFQHLEHPPSDAQRRAILAASVIFLGAMLSCVRYTSGSTVWPCSTLGLAFVALGVRWLAHGRGLASPPLMLVFGRAAQLCFLLAAAADIVGILNETWGLGSRLVPALTLCGWVSVLLLIGERWRYARGRCPLSRATVRALLFIPFCGLAVGIRDIQVSALILVLVLGGLLIFAVREYRRRSQVAVKWIDEWVFRGPSQLLVYGSVGFGMWSDSPMGFCFGWIALALLYWGLVMTEPDEVAPETSRQVSEVPLGLAGA